MDFKVMGVHEAKRYSMKPTGKIIAVISISDTEGEFPCFGSAFKYKCFLRFNDVESGEYGCITPEDGIKIKNFVNEMLRFGNIDEIVVHCTAGVSRSAGVCAAIMKAITGDDMQIFRNGNFCPNMTCYKTVLEAFFGEYDEDEAKRKEALNILLWRELNNL